MAFVHAFSTYYMWMKLWLQILEVKVCESWIFFLETYVVKMLNKSYVFPFLKYDTWYSSPYGLALGYSWWGFGWELGFKGKTIQSSEGFPKYWVFTLRCIQLDWVCRCWWVRLNYRGLGFGQIWFGPCGCAWTWAIWGLKMARIN